MVLRPFNFSPWRPIQARPGVKRSPWFGRANSAQASLLVDILTSLLTVARFVRGATLAAVSAGT
jgi:hypothetical protein